MKNMNSLINTFLSKKEHVKTKKELNYVSVKIFINNE